MLYVKLCCKSCIDNIVFKPHNSPFKKAWLLFFIAGAIISSMSQTKKGWPKGIESHELVRSRARTEAAGSRAKLCQCRTLCQGCSDSRQHSHSHPMGQAAHPSGH